MYVSKSQDDFTKVSDYFLKDHTGSRFGVNISHMGGELFQIPLEVQPYVRTEGMLDNATFLWMFIIHKLLRERDKGILGLNTPIIIETGIDKELQEPLIITDSSSNYRQMNINELLDATKVDLRMSLGAFGVSFVDKLTDDIVPIEPVLAFDIYDSTEHANGDTADVIISNYLSDSLAVDRYITTIRRTINGSDILARSDMKGIKYTYILVMGGLASRSIIDINSAAKDYNISVVNAVLPKKSDDTDNEHRDSVVNVSNQSSNGLLKHIGISRLNNEPFTDIIKLYSFLENIDGDMCISYKDFSEAHEGKLTDNQLRALALFHLQNPDKILDFEDLQPVRRTDFCRYVADLADRQEGTLSDRLIALHQKQLGKLYIVESNANCNLMAVLEDIHLSEDNSLAVAVISAKDLNTSISYRENRITIRDDADKTHMQALPYGEDPYDFRPDFVINTLCAQPSAGALKCVGTDIMYNDMPIQVIPILDAILQLNVPEAIVKAELLDYANYSFSPKSNVPVEDGKAVLSPLLQTELVTRYDWSNTNGKITDLTVGRSLQEKVYIIQSFIHRLLRYFESFLNAGVLGIKQRLLSLADLVAFNCNGEVYFGVAEQCNPQYTVRPFLSALDIHSEARRYNYSDSDDLHDCVFALNPIKVRKIMPTSVFNLTDKVPLAVQAVINWLNKKNNVGWDYKDYVSFGLRFDEWSEFLLLHSCSSAGNLNSDMNSLFSRSSDEFATLLSGCNNAIKAAYLEYILNINSKSNYEHVTEDISRLFVMSFLTIPLYSLNYATERNAICTSTELLNEIDFTFYKNVRMQYAPITIFGNWNQTGNMVTWHTTLLKNGG